MLNINAASFIYSKNLAFYCKFINLLSKKSNLLMMEISVVHKNVATLFIEALKQGGVKRIYGVVGDSLNGIIEATRALGHIDWVHVRHEEIFAFAASGEAQSTGRLAVCAGSCGPGNLHLINGLFDAHRSRTPALAIAAHTVLA